MSFSDILHKKKLRYYFNFILTASEIVEGQ